MLGVYGSRGQSHDLLEGHCPPPQRNLSVLNAMCEVRVLTFSCPCCLITMEVMANDLRNLEKALNLVLSLEKKVEG